MYKLPLKKISYKLEKKKRFENIKLFLKRYAKNLDIVFALIKKIKNEKNAKIFLS